MKRAKRLLCLCCALLLAACVSAPPGTPSHPMPKVEGTYRYDEGRGAAQVAMIGPAKIEIRMNHQERAARGEPEPHFRIFGDVQRDFGRWVFTGYWECNTQHFMQGCSRNCRDGPIAGVIESEQRIRLTEATNQCALNLSGTVLSR